MSKKDYERAARIAQECRWHGQGWSERAIVVNAFVELFRDDGNSRFDEARFRRACVPGANVRARSPKREAVSGRGKGYVTEIDPEERDDGTKVQG